MSKGIKIKSRRSRNSKRSIRVHPAARARDNYEKRLYAIKLYGGSCVRCGCDDPRVLCFDAPHGQRTMINVIIKRAGDGYFQLLCRNCNWLKQLAQIVKKCPASPWYGQFSESEIEEFEIDTPRDGQLLATEEYGERLVTLGPTAMSKDDSW